MLGDSFSNIYSLGAMGWGKSAGLVEQLAFALQAPVDAILRNDAAAHATRDLLAIEVHLRDHIKLSQQGEVIKDFFGINGPAASALKAFAAGETAVKTMAAMKE